MEEDLGEEHGDLVVGDSQVLGSVEGGLGSGEGEEVRRNRGEREWR